jgi:glycosyltransferase involved in cell wall biosynthesis
MKKFAIISLGLPPSQSGQSLVIFHLLREFDPATYCLISLKNFHQYRSLGNCSETLPAPGYFVSPDYQLIRVAIRIASKLHFKSLLNHLLRLRIRQYKEILVREKCSAVVGCTGDLLDPPAAFFASKELNLPFVFYAFDYYSRQWTDPFLRSYADQYEEAIVQGASEIIVPNECLASEYLQRYSARTTVIHNPFDLSTYQKNTCSVAITTIPAGKRIVYTGAVYEAHYTAFRNLISAIKKLKIPGLLLHIYTPQSVRNLEMNGISGPVIIHKNLPNTQMANIQKEADLLFLPLAFGSAYPDIIRTSAPGKMGEYLASGTPVLVHAPEGSFVSWFFTKHQCGMVVSDDDPDQLAKAIESLLSDKEGRITITENATRVAKTLFEVRLARDKFSQVLSRLP